MIFNNHFRYRDPWRGSFLNRVILKANKRCMMTDHLNKHEYLVNNISYPAHKYIDKIDPCESRFADKKFEKRLKKIMDDHHALFGALND